MGTLDWELNNNLGVILFLFFFRLVTGTTLQYFHDVDDKWTTVEVYLYFYHYYAQDIVSFFFAGREEALLVEMK